MFNTNNSNQSVFQCKTTEEINEVLSAIAKKQETDFPDYEMIVFSLPKYDRIKREAELERLKEFMMTHCLGE